METQPLLGVADPCPTGCGEQTPKGKLMCGKCWREVPDDLRRKVYRAWRAWSNDLGNHEKSQAYRAVRDAAIAAVR